MKIYVRANSDYFNDIKLFMDANFDAIANLCKKCGYHAYDDYKKGDSGYYFDISEEPVKYVDPDKLDTSLTRFFRKNGYRITMYPKNNPVLGGFRVVVTS